MACVKKQTAEGGNWFLVAGFLLLVSCISQRLPNQQPVTINEKLVSKKSDNLFQIIACAAKEIRTPTPFRSLPPQSSASTNFAIAATFWDGKCRNLLGKTEDEKPNATNAERHEETPCYNVQ
jgi:hypothetical protein